MTIHMLIIQNGETLFSKDYETLADTETLEMKLLFSKDHDFERDSDEDKATLPKEEPIKTLTVEYGIV